LRKWVAHPLLDREQIRSRQRAVTEALEATAGGGGFIGSTTSDDANILSGASVSTSSSNGRRTTADWLNRFIELFKKLPDLEKGLSKIQYRKIKPHEFYSLITAFQK
jgi:DNA mismatch repair ATPase MutS